MGLRRCQYFGVATWRLPEESRFFRPKKADFGQVTTTLCIGLIEVMRFFFSLMIAVMAVGSAAQTPAPGTVHASVAVAADSSNSYALYLPSAYTANKSWPLLLVFDPFGRGEVSVKLFHEAAEKYGFIVAGSNN